jgi:hypothetical protein
MSEIPRRARSCLLCEKEFLQGFPYFSALEKGKNVTRFDFCPMCWKKESRFLTFWKGVVPLKPPKKGLEKVFDLFREAYSDNETSLALSLAFSLMRKKQFVLKEEFEETYLFEAIETEELFLLKKGPLNETISEERLNRAGLSS